MRNASGILVGFWTQIEHKTAAIKSINPDLGHVQVRVQVALVHDHKYDALYIFSDTEFSESL